MLHPDAVSIVLSSCVNPDERNFYKKTKQWFSYIEKQGFLESPQALKNVLERDGENKRLHFGEDKLPLGILLRIENMLSKN